MVEVNLNLGLRFSSGLNGQSSFPGMPSFDGTSKPPVKWRRVLLKVSGEALAGDEEQNIDPKVSPFFSSLSLIFLLHMSLIQFLATLF